MQPALILQFRISPLAQDFIGTDGDGIGEIETACLADHRQPDAAVGVGIEQQFRQTDGFLAEDEVAVVGIGYIGIGVLCLCGKIVKLSARVLLKKIVERGILGDVEQIPVIQPGTFELFVVDLKAHRFDQVQTGAGSGAGAGDVAGILGNLRLHQYDI